LPRRSSTALGAVGQGLAQRLPELGVRGVAEVRQPQHGELAARHGALARLDGRDRDHLTLQRHVAGGPAVLQAQPHGGPDASLDQRHRRLVGQALDAPAVDGDDEVALLQVTAARRRVVEDLDDLQPAPVLHDRDADAGELAALLLAELGVLLRIEVVREAVVQRRDDAVDRLVGQLAARDRPVVGAVDVVDRLAHDARVAVADQRVAQEAGQPVGVRADVDPCEQQDQTQHEGGDGTAEHGRTHSTKDPPAGVRGSTP
jgi:hypothetical protein